MTQKFIKSYKDKLQHFPTTKKKKNKTEKPIEKLLSNIENNRKFSENKEEHIKQKGAEVFHNKW